MTEGLLPLVERFATWVRSAPDRIALVDADSALTYADLDRESEALAARLGGPGRVIALEMPNGLSAVVGMLAVLKAGCAFVSLDPADHAARRAWLLNDATADAVVRGSDARGFAIEPEEGAGHRFTADLAYILYTSGSTGSPKGVPVRHGHILGLVDAAVATFGFTDADVWLQYNSLAFDFSVWEIWVCLLTGGRLVFPSPRERLVGAALDALLRRTRITVLNLVPPVLHRLCDGGLSADGLSLLSYLFLGGDTFDVRDFPVCQELLVRPGPELVNLYGLTESTVVVSAYRVSRADLWRDGPGSVVGTPLPHLTVSIVDPISGRPCAPGVSGEICVWGASIVGRYWDRPTTSAEKFPSMPTLTGDEQSVLRTGDRGMIVPETHVIVHLGRLDRQLKIGAARVEPEGIENLLRHYPGVSDAVVGAGPAAGGGSIMRAALAVLDGAIVDTAAVRAFLRARLPPHEIPISIFVYDRLPVLASGKPDRRSALQLNQ